MSFNRRDFITNSLRASVLIFGGLHVNTKARSHPINEASRLLNTNIDDAAYKISIFSKHLHWLGYDEMATTAASLGFDGLDLTVRPEGHVLPERVEEDLPKAVNAATKAGLKIYSIVTAISDADDPLTERILKTAGGLGIKAYRLGWYKYDSKISIEENMKLIAGKIKKLDALNKKYNIQGLNQNHSGQYFSAPVWDLAQTLKDLNVKSTGSQYDVYHATIEGMNSWIYGFKLIQPYIKMINIKDFQWNKKDGKWITEGVPLGQGAVNWKTYLSMLKSNNVNVPVSIHYEYPLGGAEHGARELTMPKEQILSTMKKDVEFLKASLKEAGLVS
jgi:L-ribulose-5-phosphate 3-epimerase